MVTLNIREIRENKNMSQQQLAELVGCSRSYISKIENNKMNESITLHMFLNIIRALEVKPHEIFDICDYCEYKIKAESTN